MLSPHPTHIGNQGGYLQQKFRPTQAALGVGVERTRQQAMGLPKNVYTHTIGGDPWQIFRGDPGAPTSPGEIRSKSCRRTPHRQGAHRATRSERAPTRATCQDTHPPLSSCTPCSRGGNLGPTSFRVPWAFPIGGGPWKNPPPDSVSAHPGHQPHQGPLPLHASQQRRGSLAKKLQGSPDIHNSGGKPLTNWAAHRPDPASANPGH